MFIDGSGKCCDYLLEGRYRLFGRAARRPFASLLHTLEMALTFRVTWVLPRRGKPRLGLSLLPARNSSAFRSRQSDPLENRNASTPTRLEENWPLWTRVCLLT